MTVLSRKKSIISESEELNALFIVGSDSLQPMLIGSAGVILGGDPIGCSGFSGTNVRGFYESGWYWFVDNNGNIQKTQDFLTFTQIAIASISDNDNQEIFSFNTGASIHRFVSSGELVVVAQKYNATGSQNNDYITISYSRDNGVNFTLNTLKINATRVSILDSIYNNASRYVIPYEGSGSAKGYIVTEYSGIINNDTALTYVPTGTGCFIANFDGNDNGTYFPAGFGVYRVLNSALSSPVFAYSVGSGYTIKAVRYCPVLDMIMMVGFSNLTEKFYAVSKVNGNGLEINTVPSGDSMIIDNLLNLEVLPSGGFVCVWEGFRGTSFIAARTLDGLTWEEITLPANAYRGAPLIFNKV
jgi:hypothetical protein